MKGVVFHTDAEAELEEAVAYYEGKRRGLGREFQADVEAAINVIQRNPGVGGLYKDTGLRHITVGRFPYVVFYAELDDAIWIAAIAHGQRRPDYWRRRRME